MALPIRGTSLGNPQDAARIAIERGGKKPGDIVRYAVALWQACAKLGIRADVAFGQADYETGDRSTGVGFRSARWVDEGNPAGISIVTGMPDGTPGPVRTPEQWGIIHATHLGGYAGIDPGAEWKAMDIRWDAMMRAGYFGIAKDVDDLDGRWAVPGKNYGANLTARWNRYDFPAMATTPPDDGDTNGGTGMSYKTTIPGLPGGPLETSFPVYIRTPPASRTNVRPGIKARSPRLSVQHETANPNTYADAESMYLYNGSGGRQASWHFTIDDRACYTGVPVDEVGWQAGDGAGPGNYNGYATELSVHRDIVNNASRRAQSQKNAAELMGKVGARLNATPPPRQHANFMNKNCPAQLRNRGEWNRYVDWWNHFNAMEKAAMAGGGDTPPPGPVIGINDVVGTTVALNFRQAATTDAPVIETLPVGAELLVIGRAEDAGGYRWLPVRNTSATGNVEGYVAMADTDGTPWLRMVTDNADPEPEPDYVKAVPIPALLETDLQKYDTAEGITTDDTGNEFVFVADVIEFTTQTVAGEFAVAKPRPVHAPYKAGERAIAAWLVKGSDTDTWFYVLTGGDDEWVRVPFENTRRVSDAPLLGDEMHAEAEDDADAA